jgi:PST family polysaccharide transporter
VKNRFIENFFSLTLLRVITLIVPLLTFPYLIRVLGSENYGLVMWSWSIITFFTLFINFGFNLSVTKYISIHRDDKDKLSEIVSTAIATRLFLFFIALIIFLVLVELVPKMHENRVLFYLFFGLTIGETLMPIWYFQGIEKMKYTAIITSTVKILFTVLVFWVIKEKSDYMKVPILYAVASIASALIAYSIILFRDRVTLRKPTIKNMKFYIKDSVALFLSDSLFVVQGNITILFIEHYLGLSAVAYFDLLQKFINILITPFHILAKVLYPHIARVRDFVLLKRVIFFSTILSISLVIVIYILKYNIILLLFGKENSDLELLISLFSIAVIFSNISSLLGKNLLVVLGRNNKLLISILSGLIVYITLLYMMISSEQSTLELIVISITFSYAVDMISRIYFGKDILWQE